MAEKKVKKASHTPSTASTPTVAPTQAPARIEDHGDESDAPVPLSTAEYEVYRSSHNQLLFALLLVATFVLAAFPVSDPDIFPSLRVGQMVVQGTFPWGNDPFGYADGERAAWVHPGWLGDVVLYALHQWGGGPLLVLTRALLMVLVAWLLAGIGVSNRRRFLTLLVLFCGVLALTPRMYMRTELFSYVGLAATLWVLARPSSEANRGPSRWTAGRSYWILPLLFLVWANLDDWFFLGPITILLWLLGGLGGALSGTERRALLAVLLIGVIATFCSPFHVKSYAAIPVLLQPPAQAELVARHAAQQKINPAARTTEQLRLFLSPWSPDFFNTQRAEVVQSLASQTPFLPLAYPGGLSLSEWMYYVLVIAALAVFLRARGGVRTGGWALLAGFLALGAWQSRLTGFFAVAGAAMAIWQLQNFTRKPAPITRSRLVLGLAARWLLAIGLQVICLLMLLPIPDATPAPLGHVHPRGGFGFAFRVDPSLAGVARQLENWTTSGDLSGRPFHFDWTDAACYSPWFNPGGRTYFDRRYEAHSSETSERFFEIHEALLESGRALLAQRRETPAQRKARQSVWQNFFADADISHLVVRRRDLTRVTPEGRVLSVDLIFSLLDDRNESNQPVWKPLQYHDGQMFVLGWTGSRHWPKLSALAYESGSEVFRRNNLFPKHGQPESETPGLLDFLQGDPPRRPVAIDEARWHALMKPRQLEWQVLSAERVFELQGGLLARWAGFLAQPVPQIPLVFMLSDQQLESSSHLILALTAAQRAVAQLAVDAPVRQRADAYEELLDAVLELSAYEQRLTPASTRFREPLQIFALRHAALACEAAGRPRALELLLQLAAQYRQRGLVDAAWDYLQAARSFGERHASQLYNRLGLPFETPQQFVDKLPDICRQIFGAAPAEFESALKQRRQAYDQAALSSGGAGDPAAQAAHRAELALRMGLVNQALHELSTIPYMTLETAATASSVLQQLGQYDVMLDNYLSHRPELKEILGPLEYYTRRSWGWWCKGLPELAAKERQALDQVLSQESLRMLMVAENQMLLGASAQPPGSVVAGAIETIRRTGGNFIIADNRVAEGLLWLEAGRPQESAARLLSVFRDVQPSNAWRPLAARYYHQITGRLLDADLANP